MSEKNRWINPKFIGSFADVKDLPPVRNQSGSVVPEIAMLGRSNAGKSSLINSLLNWRNFAYTSKEPGKTRMLNLFQIDNWISIVDLPGYGYAKVGLEEKKLWENELPKYLFSRVPLKTVLIVMDIRRSIEEEEILLFKAMVEANKIHSCIFVGTKADKLSSQELKTHRLSFEKACLELADLPEAFHIKVIPHIVSSSKGYGIPELKRIIESLI